MKRIFLFFPILTIFVCCATAYSQQIVFLHLRIKGDTISLEDVTIRNGKLKQSRHDTTTTGMSYQVLTSKGNILWSGVTEDPLVRRYEYEDPLNPGRLKTKLVKLEEATFTIRIPFRQEADHVLFYRLVSDSLLSKMKSARLKQIGKIEISDPQRIQE